MTPIRTTLALLLLVAAVLLAAGCAGQQNPASPDTRPVEQQVTWQPDIDPQEIIPPFDSIRMDANVYNVGEVVDFSVFNENPGTGRCTDHPCSYRIARLVKNESWQVLRTPLVTMLPFSGSTYYEGSCQPMHFATNNWLPGRYRIQYRCGIFQEFVVREMPNVGVP
jgi:hypothetical protein